MFHWTWNLESPLIDPEYSVAGAADLMIYPQDTYIYIHTVIYINMLKTAVSVRLFPLCIGGEHDLMEGLLHHLVDIFCALPGARELL